MSLTVENLLLKNKINHKSSGNDFLINCLNPDHDDRHPSLRVDKLSGKMHCFSCGFKGDIFSHFGITKDLRSAKVIELQQKIRNIKTNELIIPLGHLPFEEEGYRGISAKTLRKFEAFTHIEHFPDRVVFPIRNAQNKIVGFIGRYIWSDAKPKYIFLPKSLNVPLFPSRPEIYENSLVLVEGIFDFLNLYDKGLKNVLCIFGTTSLINGKSKILPYKIMGVSKLHILFDPGAEKQAERTKRALENDFIVKIIDITKYITEEGQDPGDFSAGQVKALKRDLYESSNS